MEEVRSCADLRWLAGLVVWPEGQRKSMHYNLFTYFYFFYIFLNCLMGIKSKLKTTELKKCSREVTA